jgi:general secretion pathway protein A
MYARHFGLKREPFSIAPDPRYLYMSERHREALAHLLYGLRGGGGFVLLTGEIGAGKTTVCRCFLDQVPKRCNVAYVFNPRLSATELLRTVCTEFHIPLPEQPSAKQCIDAINEYLLRTHAVGQNNVLIIDEAQSLDAEVLEQLRLLTNLETAERKLLQIVLIGQPELRDMLAQPALEQLAQRVIARYHLQALGEAETSAYVRHRLAVAGATGALPFTRQALQRVFRITGGVPRRINLLCDRALLGAYAGGRSRVDEAIVQQAAAEVFDAATLRRASGWRWWLRRLTGPAQPHRGAAHLRPGALPPGLAEAAPTEPPAQAEGTHAVAKPAAPQH